MTRLFALPRTASRMLLVALPLAAIVSGCASTPAPEAKTEEAPVEAAEAAKPAEAPKPGERAKPAAAARPTAAARATSAPPRPARGSADEKVEEPLDQATASGQCWMQADKKNITLEAKAAFVDKCVDDLLAADAKKWAGQPKQ